MTDDALLQAGYRYALSLCHDPTEAEDLVQDAWCRLAERAGRGDRALWFTTIRNLFIDQYRRSQRAPFTSLEDVSAPPEATNHEAPNGDRLDLEAALSRLRVEEREAVYLQVVEGFTAEEIARLTDRPRGTVLSLIHRAKGKLRTLLSAESAPPTGHTKERP